MCENSRCSATASSPSHAPPAPDHAQPEGDLSLYQPLGHLADWPATRPLSPQADDHRVAVLVGLVTGHAAGAIFARAASHEPRRSMDVGGCWLERVSDLLGPTTCFAAKQSGVKGGTRSNEERGLCFLAGWYFFLSICSHTILEGGSERNFSGCPYADTTPGFLAFWLPQGLNGCIRCSGDA